MNSYRRKFKCAGVLAALLCGTASHAQLTPLITGIVETGGDNEATDTVAAKFSGQTLVNGVTGEFANPYVIPLFGEDAFTYTDRSHQWNGITAAMPLPSYLVGGEYIMIGNDNRDNASYQLDITVSEPVSVYLLIDNRLGDTVAGDPPEGGLFPTDWGTITWVGSDGYTPVMTGLNRTQDPNIPDEVGIDGNGDGVGPGVSVADYSSVYTRTVEAGTFSVFEANNAGQNMYGIVIKRVPGSLNNPPEIGGFSPTNNAVFYDPSGGLSFTATTVSPNNIAPSNVRLFLNGTNASNGLTVSGTGTSRSASFTNLIANTLYNAQIVVLDQAGRASTNTLVFDTFSPSETLNVEAEDYNFEAGQFNDGSVVNSYDTLVGTPEIDYHDINRITSPAAYRTGDFTGVGTAVDIVRPQFEGGGIDYVVNNIYTGDWLNYTRDFPSNNYKVFLRASSTANQSVRLDLVTGDRTATNQAASALGTFKVGLGGGFAYVPLTDAAGNLLSIPFSGTSTLRLTALGANSNLQLNNLLFVPADSAPSGAYISYASPAPNSAGVFPDATLEIGIANGSTDYAPGTAVLTLHGSVVEPTTASVGEETVLTFAPPALLPSGTNIPVSLVFADNAGNTISNGWSFSTVAALTTIPANFGTAPGTGLGSGFRIHIHKASNDAGTGTPPALPQTIARAEQQLNGTLIDPLTDAPYENEAGGPNGDGLTTNLVVNFQQLGNPVGFIPGDEIFPFVDPELYIDPNNIALEATAYLELTAGTHRFGVVSDDGFRVSTGPIATNANDIVLGIFDAGRGEGLPGGATEFNFFVPEDGVYPVRLLYDEGQGGASVEFYSVDPATSERILINNRSNPKAIKAYTGRSVQVFLPTVSITGPVTDTAYQTAPTNITFTVDAALTGGQVSRVEYFSGSTRLGESTNAPFTLNLTNVEAGHYTVRAVATGDNGLTATSSNIVFTVGNPLVRVNFQIATTETPDGYLPDIGEVYGDRGNGYSYGWDVDNVANARERNSDDSPSKLYDTFNHMQKPLPAGRVWEIELPNGRYSVFGASGDITATDSVFDVQAEGVTFIQGTPTAAQHFVDGAGTVSVTDGKLTIGNGPLASNSKINFLDIYALGEGGTTEPTLSNPVVNGNNITITWSGGTLQSTTSLDEPVTWTNIDASGTHTEPISGKMKFFRVMK